MGLKDISDAVEAFKKLSKEERVLFHIEAGKRRGKKPGPRKGAKKVKSKHIKDDVVPVKVVKKAPAEKVTKPKQVVDPAATVTQE